MPDEVPRTYTRTRMVRNAEVFAKGATRWRTSIPKVRLASPPRVAGTGAALSRHRYVARSHQATFNTARRGTGRRSAARLSLTTWYRVETAMRHVSYG